MSLANSVPKACSKLRRPGASGGLPPVETLMASRARRRQPAHLPGTVELHARQLVPQRHLSKRPTGALLDGLIHLCTIAIATMTSLSSSFDQGPRNSEEVVLLSPII